MAGTSPAMTILGDSTCSNSALMLEGEVPDPGQLRREVEERDRRDSQRSVAPMHPADDAVVVETDHLDLDGVVAEVLRSIREPA